MRSKIATLLFILTISVLASIPLIKPGLYTMHDDQQVARLFLFDKSIKSGQFPPRWVDDLGFGFGYPLFNFYPPAVYVLGDLFHLFGLSFISSIKLVFFTSIFLSGVSMYILTKEYLGKLSALVSASFYIFVPYRALDVYVRGALAESFSFVWLPLIIWSLLKLKETNSKNFAITSGIFLAFLMVTHNLIFLALLLILAPTLAFLFIISKSKKTFLYQSVLSIFVGFSLSAFFWVPALFEKKFTIVDDLLIVNLASYKIHFVYLQQLWNWTWGYGGSTEGLMDGLSFKIGKVHLVVSFLTFIFTTMLIYKKTTSIELEKHKLFVFFFLMFLFSAFMTTQYSSEVWKILTPLAYLQFPWRFLTFCALFSSILAGALVYVLKVKVLKVVATIVLIGLVVIPNIKLFRPQFYRLNLTDESATAKDVINWDVSSSSFEYSPKGIVLKKNDKGANIIDIQKEGIPTSLIAINSGYAQLDILKINPSLKEFALNSNSDTFITTSIFDFPNWKVYVDNKEVTHSSQNNLKLISFTVPQGAHQVKIRFENTPLRICMNLISLVSILSIGIFFLKKNGRLRISA